MSFNFSQINPVVDHDELAKIKEKVTSLTKLSGAEEARSQLIMILSEKPNWTRNQIMELFDKWFESYKF